MCRNVVTLLSAAVAFTLVGASPFTLDDSVWDSLMEYGEKLFVDPSKSAGTS